jgi:hypothetical protein
MLNDKRFILPLFMGLVFSVAVIDVLAQSEGRNHKRSQAAAQNERLQTDGRKNPILLSVRAGTFVLADLVGPDPRDTDAVIVEVKGVRRSFKLDEVRIQPQASKFDEYGDIRFNDEKARLDNYAIQLQNTPSTLGYVIVYGTYIGQARPRAKRIRDYLVNTRGLDRGRLVSLDGTCRKDFSVELWVVPGAADPPTNSEATLNPCPTRPKPKQTRKSRSRKRS